MLYVNYIAIILGWGRNIWIKLLDLEEMGEKIVFWHLDKGQSHLNREEIQIFIKLFSSIVLYQKKMK